MTADHADRAPLPDELNMIADAHKNGTLQAWEVDVLREAAAALADAEEEIHRLRSEIVQMGGDEHVVVLDDDGWTLEHPSACRADGPLADCSYTRAARDTFTEPTLRGRYQAVMTSTGLIAPGEDR